MKRLFNLKNNIFKSFSFVVMFAFLLLSFSPALFGFNTLFNANAQNARTLEDIENGTNNNEDEEIINYTVFIRKATFSIIYNGFIFFIDEDKNLDSTNYSLKVYNTEAQAFESKYIELTDISNITDVAYFDGKFFVLTNDGIFVLNLDINDLKYEKLTLEKEFSNFSAISVYKYQDDTDETNYEVFILLTPIKDADETTNPEIIILNSNLEFQSSVKINFTQSQSLVKVISVFQEENSSAINLLFVCETEVYYMIISRETLNAETISVGSDNKFNTPLETTDSNMVISSINVVELNNIPYLLVSYKTVLAQVSQSYSVVYEFKVSSYTDTTSFVKKKSFNNELTDYALTIDNLFVYSTDQIIRYVNIEIEEDEILIFHNEITNPKTEIEYYEEEDFIYSRVTKDCYILETPWSPVSLNETPKIKADTDVIIIGKGFIPNKKLNAEEVVAEDTNISKKTPIEDYLYCLYTDEDKNYVGFIETANLVSKETLLDQNLIELIKYTKILKAKPNATLYSLPTKISGDQITNNLTSYIKLQIKDNSRIEFIDDLYCYTSNNSIFLKVMVNNQDIGYIEYDSLIRPSDAKNFVITNSYITEDGTYVYLEANTDTIIYLLNSDKRVRINGVRDTNTGFTYITFNDEYGNEFSGYIKNDQLKTDGWSTLQIIGCIFIAINVGLLILILYFRDTRIGINGEKYIKNKKSN